MWETAVRYFQKSIRIIRTIRGRKKKEYEHQWFNLTTDIADLADKILTKEKAIIYCLAQCNLPGSIVPKSI